MAKRVSTRTLKANRAYTVEEAAETLNVSPQTVRVWGKQGLPMLKERRPHLIMGFNIKGFLNTRTAQAKRPLKFEEVFCPRCREPRKPYGMMVDYIPINSTRGRLVALCSECECQCSRLASLKSLDALSEQLQIVIRSHGDA